MPLTPNQVLTLRGRLLDELTRLQAADDRAIPPLRENEREVGDEMDEAENALVQGDAAQRTEHDRALRGEVEQALGRIDSGTYGLSEMSGDEIDYPRLEAVPWARYTVREQEELERQT